MTYDEDWYNYEKQYEFESFDKKDYYTASEWENRSEKYIPSMLGSVISPSPNPKYRKLAQVHRRSSYAENKSTQVYSRYNSVKDQYAFLTNYMPSAMFDRICQIMGYLRISQKKFAKDVNLNIERLAVILAFWQLELYTKNDYIKEPVLQEINDFLISQSSYRKFRNKGHVSLKDIQRAEGNILKDLYSLENGETPKYYFDSLPKGTLEQYKSYLAHLEDYIPEDYGPLKKLRQKNIEFRFNGRVFTWVIRKETMKKLIHNLAYQYDIILSEKEDSKVEYLIERLFLQREVNALGDIPSLCIVMLDYLRPDQIVLQENMPKRFYTRINSYRRKIIPILSKLDLVGRIQSGTLELETNEVIEGRLLDNDSDSTENGVSDEIYVGSATPQQEVRIKSELSDLNNYGYLSSNDLVVNPKITPISRFESIHYSIDRTSKNQRLKSYWMFRKRKHTRFTFKLRRQETRFLDEMIGKWKQKPRIRMNEKSDRGKKEKARVSVLKDDPGGVLYQ